ncbi:hypothetical protein DL96DRAFT_1592068 [Flagelloscypha sp. PMI_526]|nr:hypothetical protein DL96DRAFT_1592068 [Flagelloscypha sp. PMI_526]
MLLQLPNEVLDTIAESNAISAKDLTALSRVNSCLLPVSRRILYRSTAIRLSPGPDAFLPAFLANSDIGSFVTSFSFTCPFDATEPFLPLYQQLAMALSGMPNIVVADLQLPPSSSWVLRGCRWPLLQAFRSSFQLDNNVLGVLTHSSLLQSIEMTSNFLPGDCHKSLTKCCPSLNHFIGPPQVAALLVPGRPVERVHVLGTDLTPGLLDKLAASTRPIEVLEASVDYAHLPHVLRQLRHNMSKLVHVRLPSRIPIERVSWAEEDEISALLEGFSRLRSVELCGLRWKYDSCRRRWILPTFSPSSHELAAREDDWASWTA